ncbi:MAG: histidine kinase [Humibacillus sp.]|nr:histidine kinase [Humibacillus sp.]MDN5778560.1 histidine kinase [Humibacillus sp.]
MATALVPLIGLALVPSVLAVQHPVNALDVASSGADLVVQIVLTITGLLLLRDHEHRRSGLLLVLAGAAIGIADLAWTDLALTGGWWLQVGWWTHWSAVVFLLPVLLAYPGARMARRNHEALVGLMALVLLGWRGVEALLFHPAFTGYDGPIRWVSLPGTSLELYGSARMVGVALVGGLCVWLAVAMIQRWRRARSIARWPTRMTAGIGIALTMALAVRVGTEYALERGWVTPAWADTVDVFQQLLLAAAPIGLLILALRTAVRRGAVLERLFRAAGDPVAVEQLLRKELDDPQLRLLYPVGSFWLDGQGAIVGETPDPPPPRPGRMLCGLCSRGDNGSSAEQATDASTPPDGPNVLVDVDEQAQLDPVRLRTTLTATEMVLENIRLAVERDANAAEVATSRTRIVEAGMAQRRQLERDLHDGAQQHLLTVATTLSRARMAAEQQQMRATLDQARTQLTTALAELRNLARGIHPAGLSQGGLVTGVRGLVSGDQDLLIDVGPGLDAGARAPEAVETAAYFVVAEAVTNARKHADTVHVAISMALRDSQLQLVVADTGVGGARLCPGGGLAGLADRVVALGGTFALHSPVGGGTTVTVVLPCTGAPAPKGARGLT